jgi:hypothetical protein
MVTCPIWGTPAEEMPRLGDNREINSRRAGGEYKISGTALSMLERLSVPEKKRLTTWIVSQHKAGVAVPGITSDVLDAIKLARGMGFSERVDEAVSFYGTRTKIGGVMPIDNADSRSRERLNDFLALTESIDADEAQTLLKMMEGMGLMTTPHRDQDTLFSMLPNGWLRFEELQKKQVQSSQAFVAMWFDPTTKSHTRTAYT